MNPETLHHESEHTASVFATSLNHMEVAQGPQITLSPVGMGVNMTAISECSIYNARVPFCVCVCVCVVGESRSTFTI